MPAKIHIKRKYKIIQNLEKNNKNNNNNNAVEENMKDGGETERSGETLNLTQTNAERNIRICVATLWTRFTRMRI